MGEKNYRICLTAPLGARNGYLVLHETGGRVEGWLDVMNERNGFSGMLSEDGRLTLSGVIRTLVSTLPYTATGTVSGRRILLDLKTDSGTHFPVSGEELQSDDKMV